MCPTEKRRSREYWGLEHGPGAGAVSLKQTHAHDPHGCCGRRPLPLRGTHASSATAAVLLFHLLALSPGHQRCRAPTRRSLLPRRLFGCGHNRLIGLVATALRAGPIGSGVSKGATGDASYGWGYRPARDCHLAGVSISLQSRQVLPTCGPQPGSVHTEHLELQGEGVQLSGRGGGSRTCTAEVS